MVLTVSFVLSPVTMLVCHRRLRFTRQLDTSVGVSGPHDFSVRVSAVRPWRHPRPPHPASYVFDDRETPLRGNGTAGDIEVIWGKREAEYFCKGGWTGFGDLPGRAKSMARPALYDRAGTGVDAECGGSCVIETRISLSYLRFGLLHHARGHARKQ
jgi:hypothetical protein